jgi:outer membrane receptor for ferrienterochelin and colicins
MTMAHRLSLLLLACAFVALPAAGQTGRIIGQVTDAGGAGIPGVSITVVGTQAGTAADVEGRFTLSVAPGSYTIRFTHIGYRELRRTVPVAANAEARLNVSMEEAPVSLADQIVITGSRRAEKLLDAPVTIETITPMTLEMTGGGTFLSALGQLKGVDFVDVGINAQGISARGFASQFNTRMLSMTDGRVAQLPGTGLPQGNFLPISPLDVKAIEVVVGPASALYGPNAHTGVVNVITKDPWDQSGVSLALRGGQNNLIDGTFRLAGTVNDRFGFKVTGQYLTAEDFSPADGALTHRYNTTLDEGRLLGDYETTSFKYDGSLYARIGTWMARAGYGWSENTGFGMTNAGRNHIREWQISYQTAQVSNENWFAQVTRTANDAGRTYQINQLASTVQTLINNGNSFDSIDRDAIREGLKFVDRGELIDSEIQFRDDFGPVALTTGLQYRLYKPDSDGTFLADASGENIDATEFGGYLQADVRVLDDRLRLVGAARVDNHSNYGTQLSPKVGIVYNVAPSQNLRLTFNRAYKSPTVLESNLLINNFLRGNIDGFTIRNASGDVVSVIDPLRPEEVNAIELGYKGVFGQRLFVDVVGYNSWYTDFISPLSSVANPFAGTIGYNADGTMVAAGTPFQGFLWTYFNFGKAQVRGLDLGLNYYASEVLSLSGSASYISLVDFTNESVLPDLLLNVPELKLKGSVTVMNALPNVALSLSGRYQSAYEFISGYWSSHTFFADNDNKIDARLVADVTATYTLPVQGVTFKGSVSNIFDDQGIDVLGAPVRGRFMWLSIGYNVSGLRF